MRRAGHTVVTGQARYRKAADVREKSLGGTFFLFTPRGGFDGVGRDIWELVVAGRTLDEIVEEICSAFDAEVATVRHDVVQLIGDVCDQGLVEVDTGAR